MKLTRREFVKTNAIAATATAAGITLPGMKEALANTEDTIRWDKAPCRFCGTGCSVLVGTQNGRIVATQGDPDAPVNRGLNCIKGYFLSKIMYGKDRLTKPLLRKTNGVYDKEGDFEEVSWDEAFDIMAEKWKAAMKKDMAANAGKPVEKMTSTVGMFGSGQWTIFEGYAASKLMKAGFRSNHIDPNARHCMASAVGGFMRAFGADEPMGCYDDLEHADAFVLWGSNMSEMHPILWTRITDTRLTKDNCEVHVLSTYKHRSFDLADNPIIFKPQTDLAILNYIANYIIQNKAYDENFINKHVHFKKTPTDIGYGLRPEHPLEKKKTGKGGKLTGISFEEYAKSVEPYTLEKAHEISGVPKENLLRLAKLYADPKKKITSLWTMGFNQHTRGVWVNGLMYNVHLLTGKISQPGNGPFSLTGQPSACGTAREVGTFCHRLPADYVVKKKAHRDFAEKIWELPEGTIPGKVGYHAVLQNRMLKDGKLNVYWVMCNNNMQAAANLNEETLPGYRNPDNFIVVSDPYPTVTAMAADLILPTAMWTEKEGAYGNAERRTQFWRQQVKAPGEAKSDLWQLMEFAKRFKMEDVWPADLLAKAPQYKGKNLFNVLFENGFVNQYKKQTVTDERGNEYANDEMEAFGFYPQKGLFEEYRRFQHEGVKKGHEQAPFDTYHKVRGLRWPVPSTDHPGTKHRFTEEDPLFPKEKAKGRRMYFYGKPDGKAVVFARPAKGPEEPTDAEYPFALTTGRVLEHFHTMTMTGQVPQLVRAVPGSYVEINPKDAARLGIADKDKVRVVTRRGELELEARVIDRPREKTLFVPWHWREKLANLLTIDAFDPGSKEPEYKVCAAKVVKV